MLGTHAWIGVLEGGADRWLVAPYRRWRDVYCSDPPWRPALIGIAAGLLLAALVLPISSSLPDGYEAAAQASGMAWLLAP